MKKLRYRFLIVIILVTLIFSGIKVESNDDGAVQKLQNVFYLIQNYYVEEMNYDELVEKAVRGVLRELDNHSMYMNKDEYEDMKTEFEGHFGGIGIEIGTRDDQLTIISPIKGTPGEDAGLQSEDVILEVDGKPTSEMSQSEAVEMMRGEEGTEVELTIFREEKDRPFDVTITRDDIEIPVVESELKEDNVGYISIYYFHEETGEQVSEAVSELEEEGAEALIVDVRGNGGGLLDQAVKVSSIFVEEGEIVSVRGRATENTEHRVEEDMRTTSLPTAVLINGGSASASEIFAAAISDHERGVLIGTKTFGKGSVQNLIPLDDGSAVKMTTAHYYTPDGTNIHKKGIKPDLEVEYDIDTEEDEQLEEALDVLQSILDAEDKEEKMDELVS
ncbi:MAG: S41 family peptidase [Halanaerobiaceae bacterium]